ncbi:hypothetical protein SESBI_16720 [Sesbania bispinosa]|nr:hypothetical protein SESBI_16720 [Sesbania bispinosa]
MGMVSAVLEEINLSKEGRQTRLMLIDLVDEMTTCSYNPIGKGEVGIQNVMNASKVYWNPDIPEATEFKSGLAVHEIETEVEIRTITERSRPLPAKEEFLKMYPKKSVAQLQQLDEDGCFVIVGVVDQGINSPTHPSDIINLVGNEYLFRVERKDDPSLAYEECYRVKRLAPSFTKIEGAETNKCVIKMSPQCNSAVTEIEISPISMIPSPAVLEDTESATKRDLEQVSDALTERKKRLRKLIKVEKH